MKVIESKSILAKLLATENISVEHHNIPTAAFDVQNRKLMLPEWTDMSDSLYDLLLGHEVGHARFTPPEGWHDVVRDSQAKKGFYNVLEDVRIERFIKKEYPGLVKSFYAGYRELFNKNFFGTEGTDITSLSFIDRINLHYKVGSFLNVKFSDDEKLVLARLENADTWDEIATLAEELYGNAKEEKENQQSAGEEEQFGDESDEGEDGQGSDMSYSDDSEEEADQDDDQSDSPMSESDSADGDYDDQEMDEFDSLFSPNDDYEEMSDFEESNEPRSITDEAFRDNENQLLDSEKRSSCYVNVPKFDPTKYVISSSEMYSGLDDSFHDYKNESLDQTATVLYTEFRRKNTSIVNSMIQQFEMKRKASESLKARVAKTGDLNEDRLWAYKISEDIFKQSTILPKGKNHGMIMYLDMSGSMRPQIANTIEQMLTLVMFCKKINVPFDVYGFTSNNRDNDDLSRVPGDARIADLRMPHLFSSKFNKMQTVEAFKHLLIYSQTWDYNSSLAIKNRNYGLGTTPLNSALMVGIEIAKQFRKDYKVEVLNTIILTDGGATDYIDYVSDEISEWNNKYRIERPGFNENVVFKYGSVSVGFDSSGSISRHAVLTTSLLELYKQITGSTLVNYHLVNRWTQREVESDFMDYYKVNNPSFDYQEAWDAWASARGTGMIVAVDKAGFDTRFIMRSSKIKIDEEELTVKSNKKGDLLRGFKKFAGNKRTQRIFINKFMDLVA